MNERRKLINWMAGVTTFIVVLLIVIVLLDREEDGVSLAAASRTVALTLESGNGILENAPETSNFDEDLSDQWYVKYMDYLYGQGYLDSGSVKADERSATSAVTYAVLSDWAKKASEEGKGETDALLSYVDSGDRAKKAVSSENFWKFYDAFLAAVDPDRAVARWRRTFTEHRTMWMVRLHGQPTRGTVFFSLRDFTSTDILTRRSGFWRETMRS